MADARSGRDTRLLALVILIAAGVLLVLARFRFPATDSRSTTISAAPLERLAGPASYDELAAAVNALVLRQTPSLVLLHIEVDPQSPNAAPAAPPVLSTTPPGRRRAIGIRLSPATAVAYLPAGYRVSATSSESGLIEVKRVDVRRELVVLRSTDPGTSTPFPVAATNFAGFAYVAAVEAGVGGPTAKPVFIGRVDAVDDDRWGSGVIAPGGTTDLPVGSLVFTLDGRLIGLTIRLSGDEVAIVPVGVLDAAAQSLSGKEPAP